MTPEERTKLLFEIAPPENDWVLVEKPKTEEEQGKILTKKLMEEINK